MLVTSLTGSIPQSRIAYETAPSLTEDRTLRLGQRYGRAVRIRSSYRQGGFLFHDSSTSGIESYGRGTVTMVSTTSVWKVSPRMVENVSRSLVIARVAKMFRDISEVKRVYELPQEGFVLLTILVNMPQYDYALMQRLIDVEIHAARCAREYQCQLDFRYLPYQHLDPQLVDIRDFGTPVDF